MKTLAGSTLPESWIRMQRSDVKASERSSQTKDEKQKTTKFLPASFHTPESHGANLKTNPFHILGFFRHFSGGFSQTFVFFFFLGG